MASRDTHGTFRPEDIDMKVESKAPLATTVAVPATVPEEQAPIQPHLTAKVERDPPVEKAK
jgi:hypothetical protein